MGIYTEFGNLIDQYLAARDMSGAQLARRLSVSTSTVNRWRNGQTRPDSPELVVRVADVLGIHGVQRERLLRSAGYGVVVDDGSDKPPKLDEEIADAKLGKEPQLDKDARDGRGVGFLVQAVRSWAQHFFKVNEADDHARTSWAGMTIYLLRTAMERISGEGFLLFLVSIALFVFSLWFIGPILTWPQSEPTARLIAAMRFAAASLFVPALVALLTEPDGATLWTTNGEPKWRTVMQLKLAGAFTGFGALGGTGLFAAVIWYHLFRQPLPSIMRGILVFLMLFFTYVAARRIPIDRYKMFDGEVKLHNADPLFLTVFVLFGPFLAGFFYVAYPMLINPAVMLAVLLGCIGLAVWELRKSGSSRFTEPVPLMLLGLLLLLGWLLLFVFDLQI